MKKVIPVFTLLVSSVVCQSAFSQANPFEGFYGQLSTGYESNSFTDTSTQYTNLPPNGSGSGSQNASNQTAAGMPLIAGIGYNFALSEKWILGVGTDYSFLSQTTSQFSAKNPEVPGTKGISGQQIQASNRVNVFITPGYVLSPTDLIYAKLGYSNQQIQFSRPGQDGVSGYSPSANQNGYVLGLGYRKIISAGFYLYAEANYMGYSSATLNSSVVQQIGAGMTATSNVNQNPSANAYTLLIGAGYKF